MGAAVESRQERSEAGRIPGNPSLGQLVASDSHAMTDLETLYVVDDDAALRQALSQRLRLAGYSVRSYPGPREFLAAVDLKSPGCAILDLNMPDMTGLELLRLMTKRGASLPVIIQSGYCDRRSRSEALALGATAVLDKPVPSSRLLQLVEAALRRIRRRSPAESHCVTGSRTRLSEQRPRQRQGSAPEPLQGEAGGRGAEHRQTNPQSESGATRHGTEAAFEQGIGQDRDQDTDHRQ